MDGISFSIPEGVCFGLLGPNGAGKNHNYRDDGRNPDATAGKVFFREKEIDQNFKKKVGIQFQNTALPEFITVKETLELFRSLYPNPRTVDEIVGICSLSDIIDRTTESFPADQRQRMLLGLAIIPRPQMLFLDEPTTGLDPQARRNFWDPHRKDKGRENNHPSHHSLHG